MSQTRHPGLPDAIEQRELELTQFDVNSGEEMPRILRELQSLKDISYKEITFLTHYLAGHSPFETQHGVKGAELENVLVVVGRGWNQYNFNEMLELASNMKTFQQIKKKHSKEIGIFFMWRVPDQRSACRYYLLSFYQRDL